MRSTLIAGIILVCLGLLLIFQNKPISSGAAAFYKKFYTKKNLAIMFKAVGVLLIIVGLALIFKFI